MVPFHMEAPLQEYDAVMLETYELRDSLRGARKELAASLYQHDAACRTIARLTQEKEAAQKALEDLGARLNDMQANAAPQGAAEGPEGPPSKRVCSHRECTPCLISQELLRVRWIQQSHDTLWNVFKWCARPSSNLKNHYCFSADTPPGIRATLPGNGSHCFAQHSCS